MRLIPFAFAIVIFFSAAVVRADDVTVLDDVGGWKLGIDHTLGDGCFIYAEYEGGEKFRIGFQVDGEIEGYGMIGNHAWKSLEKGKDYRISIQFDDEDPWYADATAEIFGGQGLPILFFTFGDFDFLEEFMRKHEFRVRYKDRQIAHLTLRGSHAAGTSMIACQAFVAEQQNGRGDFTSGDPFYDGRPPRSDDPFR